MVERVRDAESFARLHALIVEYEKSLPAVLRHGEQPTLAQVAAAYAEPHAAFLAFADGAASACIAMHQLDATTVVLIRLYVQDAYRGRGLARQLVAAVVERARQGGYARVVLDTDKDMLPAAYELYRALGFRACEPYGPVDYATPTFLELRLNDVRSGPDASESVR